MPEVARMTKSDEARLQKHLIKNGHKSSSAKMEMTKVTKVNMEKLDGSGSIHDGVENVAAVRDVGSASSLPVAVGDKAHSVSNSHFLSKKPTGKDAVRRTLSRASDREEALKILFTDKLLSREPHCVASNSNSKDVYIDFPNKFECPVSAVAVSTKINSIERKSSENSLTMSTSPTQEVAMVLSGPFAQVNKSPLTEYDARYFSQAKSSFDNIATKDRIASISRESSFNRPTVLVEQKRSPVFNNSNSMMSSLSDILEAGTAPTPVLQGKKRKPKMQIAIPKEISSIKQLSASEARKMDEAVELANSFSHVEHKCSTPRTPGSTTKESPRSGIDSPTGHTWFPFRKRNVHEEKKTFVEGLCLSPNGMVTPEALEAYDALVTGNSGEKNTLPLNNTTPTSTSSRPVPAKRSFNFPRLRSSVSESGRGPTPVENGPPTRFTRQRDEYSKAWTASPLKVRNGLKRVNRNGQQYCEGILSELLEYADSDGRNSPALTVSDIVGTSTSTINTDTGSGTTISMNCSTPKTISPPHDNTPLNGSQEIGNSSFSLVGPCIFQRSTSMFETGSRMSAEHEQTNCPRTPVCESDISPYAEINSESIESELRTLYIDESCSSTSRTSISSLRPPSTISSLTAFPVSLPAKQVEEVPGIPPPLPPRIPLRQSTINARPAQRRYPLPSDPVFPPTDNKPRTMSEMTLRTHRKILPVVDRSCELPRRVTRSTDVNTCRTPDMSTSSSSSSSSASSSSGSEQLNVSNESDNVFPRVRSPSVPNGGFSQLNIGTLEVMLKSPNVTHPQPVVRLVVSVKSIKLNASELGIDDRSDIFWIKQVTFDLPNTEQIAEQHNDSSDEASYEDLMETALEVEDNRTERRKKSTSFEEIHLMQKVLSEEVAVDDCTDALNETSWNVHKAIKLIKLKQLLLTKLADKQQCKQALMFCRWNIEEATSYLLAPPSERPTLSIVDVGL